MAAQATALPLKFKHGAYASLPEAIENGTVYIAKTEDGKAYMYVDQNDERLNILSSQKSYYAIAEDANNSFEDEIVPGLPGKPGLTTSYATDFGFGEFIPGGSFDTVAINNYNIECENFELKEGATIIITFTKQGVFPLQLNINNTGSIEVVSGDTTGIILPNSTYTFVYDGTYYQMISNIGLPVTPVEAGNYPLLIANKSISNTTTTHAIVPAENQILVNVAEGSIQVPGGIKIADSRGGTTFLTGGRLSYVCDDNSYYLDINNTGFQLSDENRGSNIVYINESSVYVFPSVLFSDTVEIGLGLQVNEDITCASDIYSNGKRVPNVYSGSDAPDNSIGKDGDIYIQLN